jgi:hypothetical protein
MKTKEHDVKVTYTIVGEETELQDPNKLEISQIAQQPVCLAYQTTASSTFLSEQTSHQQQASSTFLSEQTSTSDEPPANRRGCVVTPRDRESLPACLFPNLALRAHLTSPPQTRYHRCARRPHADGRHHRHTGTAEAAAAGWGWTTTGCCRWSAEPPMTS